MPLRKHGNWIKNAAAVAAAAVACVALPAAASAACVEAPASQSFSKFGDTSYYSAAPGGTFEAPTGWKFSSGAQVISGNETAGVSGGSKSLLLNAGATALSPEFCVDQTKPHFRFMKKSNFFFSSYVALVLYRDTAGKLTQAQIVSSKDTALFPGLWKPSANSPLATLIPLLSPTSPTASVQILFQAGFGSTQIDSVMVDPYRRG